MNLNSSNTDDSFTMANSNLIFESLRNSSASSRKQMFREIFLFYHEIVCCVYSLESPHRGDSNEYTQHTTIVKEIKKKSLNYRYLLPDLAPWLTHSGSNYPCLEQFSMVPKMFEPLKFDCTMLIKIIFQIKPMRRWKWNYIQMVHYENTPIQIYWKFYSPKNENFQIKSLIFFLFLLKT